MRLRNRNLADQAYLLTTYLDKDHLPHQDVRPANAAIYQYVVRAGKTGQVVMRSPDADMGLFTLSGSAAERRRLFLPFATGTANSIAASVSVMMKAAKTI